MLQSPLQCGSVSRRLMMKALLVLSVVLLETAVNGQISTPVGKTPARVLERRKVGNDDELTVAVEDSFLDDKGQRTAYVDPIPCVQMKRIGNRVTQWKTECLPRITFANAETTAKEPQESPVITTSPEATELPPEEVFDTTETATDYGEPPLFTDKLMED